jgi:hypothetical protein
MTQPSDWLSVIVGANLSVPSLVGVSPIASGDSSGILMFGSPTNWDVAELNAATAISIAVAPYEIAINGASVEALGDGTITTLASTITVGADTGQALFDDSSWGTATANSTTPVNCASYTTESNSSGYIILRISGRCTIAGGGVSVGDTWVGEYTVGFKNISGTASVVGTLTANNGSPFHDSSLAGVSIAISSTTNKIVALVTSVASATVIYQTRLGAFVV